MVGTPILEFLTSSDQVIGHSPRWWYRGGVVECCRPCHLQKQCWDILNRPSICLCNRPRLRTTPHLEDHYGFAGTTLKSTVCPTTPTRTVVHCLPQGARGAAP